MGSDSVVPWKVVMVRVPPEPATHCPISPLWRLVVPGVPWVADPAAGVAFALDPAASVAAASGVCGGGMPTVATAWATPLCALPPPLKEKLPPEPARDEPPDVD